MNPTPRTGNRMDKQGQSYLGHLGAGGYPEDAVGGHLERGEEGEDAEEHPATGDPNASCS